MSEAPKLKFTHVARIGQSARPHPHATGWFEYGCYFVRDAVGWWMAPDGEDWRGPFITIGDARGAAKALAVQP